MNTRRRVVTIALLGTCWASTVAGAALQRGLAEPAAWFSMPVVGITEIEPHLDGVTVSRKGTVAYKNRLEWRQLRFEINFTPDVRDGAAVLLQFDKQRRDSSIDDHHLHNMGLDNRSYGLRFDVDGTVTLLRLREGRGGDPLLAVPTGRDFAWPVRVTLTQQPVDGQVEFSVRIEDEPPHRVRETLPEGYALDGFLGLTICEGNTHVTLRKLQFEGAETPCTAGEPPRPVHDADCFVEPHRRLVHWRYDETTNHYRGVRVETPTGDFLAETPFPRDYWIVPPDCELAALRLRTVDVDGRRGAPVSVPLVDDHADYYAAAPPGRVAIRRGDGPATFCLMPSGTPFVVRGVNYVRLRLDHSTFEPETDRYPACYDPYDVETCFKRLKRHGFNTVRVFLAGRNWLNRGLAGDHDNTAGLYGPYLDNVVDFLQRARRYGLYVLPNLCDGELPLNQHYLDLVTGLDETVRQELIAAGLQHNVLYLSAGGVAAKRQYLHDFLEGLRQRDPGCLATLLALELRNELFLRGDQWPFTLDQGSIVAADGRTYDMADNDQRQRLYEDGLTHYHTQMVQAAKAVDPDLLVCQGFYTPRIVGKDAVTHYGVRQQGHPNPSFPPPATVVGRAPLDFLDIHIYHVNPGEDLAEAYRLDMATTGLGTPAWEAMLRDKPFILGEFGSFKFMAGTFEQAAADMLQTRDLALADGAQGHAVWTYDTFEQRSLWHAAEGGAALLDPLGAAP